MYKAIIEESADRADFLSRLFSRPRPANSDTASTPEALFASGGHIERRATKRNPVPDSSRSTLTMHQQLPAVRAAMPLVAKGIGLPLAQALKLETDAFVQLAGSDDSRQRIAEFFANRKK